jgi:hypothetical protein
VESAPRAGSHSLSARIDEDSGKRPALCVLHSTAARAAPLIGTARSTAAARRPPRPRLFSGRQRCVSSMQQGRRFRRGLPAGACAEPDSRPRSRKPLQVAALASLLCGAALCAAAPADAFWRRKVGGLVGWANKGPGPAWP